MQTNPQWIQQFSIAEDPFFIAKMSHPGFYAREEGLFMAGAVTFGVNIVIIPDHNSHPRMYCCGDDNAPVLYLAYIHGNHYEGLLGTPNDTLKDLCKNSAIRGTFSPLPEVNSAYQNGAPRPIPVLKPNSPSLSPSNPPSVQINEEQKGLDLSGVLVEALGAYKSANPKGRGAAQSFKSAQAIIANDSWSVADEGLSLMETQTIKYARYVLHETGNNNDHLSLKCCVLRYACQKAGLAPLTLVKRRFSQEEAERALRDILLFQLGVREYHPADRLDLWLRSVAQWVIQAAKESGSKNSHAIIRSFLLLQVGVKRQDGLTETRALRAWLQQAGENSVLRDQLFEVCRGIQGDVAEENISTSEFSFHNWLAEYSSLWSLCAIPVAWIDKKAKNPKENSLSATDKAWAFYYWLSERFVGSAPVDSKSPQGHSNAKKAGP